MCSGVYFQRGRRHSAWDAVPVRFVELANCLFQLSRVGIPREVLTDCGTNFLSKLTQQVYQLLGIRGIKTTPYHPQMDGLVERFSQTLKSMLHKFVSRRGSDWDQWLPYWFAYREVPQVSTGFSPSPVEGPLGLLKEHWEGENVVSYVVKMRQRLDQMTALAQEHLKAAQANQKTGYNRKARDRPFEPGQKVLLLLSTSDSKLLARWQGQGH